MGFSSLEFRFFVKAYDRNKQEPSDKVNKKMTPVTFSGNLLAFTCILDKILSKNSIRNA
jgi:hypothetical protein